MFGLRVRRHRLFELNFDLEVPLVCNHKEQGRPVGVWNWGSWGHEIPRGGKSASSFQDAMHAMGINHYMSKVELCESIPPAYTEWIGKQIISKFFS